MRIMLSLSKQMNHGIIICYISRVACQKPWVLERRHQDKRARFEKFCTSLAMYNKGRSMNSVQYTISERRGMKQVQSADGTTIAYDQMGNGPAVILVDGALGYRAFGYMVQLATLLAPRFTVIIYDRRGRGESTDTQPFAVEREIEDIEALINEVGGEAFLYGISSGACLALEAAIELGPKVKKLALYEAPYDSDDVRRQAFRNYRKRLAELLAEGRQSDALGLFMMFVGMPPEHLEGARQQPMWPMWEAVAHTLPYDAAAMGEDGSVPTEKAARLTIPTLVMDGSASFPFMYTTAVALAKAIPNSEHRTLEGQTHEVEATVLAPVLAEFFNS
jgi:pimeloyl-ACP methyl ester carboxylesterase